MTRPTPPSAAPVVVLRHENRQRDRSRRAREDGTSTVELAMYMPIMFFFIFLTVQASLVFLGNQAASAAAREASRVARAGGGSAQAIRDGEERGRQYAADVGHGLLDDVEVRIVTVAPDQVRATVSGKGIQVVPGIPGLHIRQIVQGPVEEFRPDV